MNYNETCQFLFEQVPMFQNLGAGAYKPGLDTTLRLSEAFGSPHKNLRFIHVGGTNGKGSTSSTIAAILQSAGYTTGLFTSPHLVDFRERIRIDGLMIPKEYVCRFVSEYLADTYLTSLRPTFFELTTVMALRYFADRHVDAAVMEVGLGGRLDSTNIISPELCIVTNISPDHTKLLGDTPEKIAAEKAGIFKPGVPAIVGAAEGGVRRVFEETAMRTGTPLVFACDSLRYTSAEADGSDAIVYRGTQWGDIRSTLTGEYQRENANTVFTALDVALTELFPDIDTQAIAHGFSEVNKLTGLYGRWTHVTHNLGNFDLYTDTGHNIGGWKYLGPTLNRMSDNLKASGHQLTMIIGFVNDKDVEAIMEQMPRHARYIFTRPSVSRGRSAASTAEIAHAHGLNGVIAEDGVAQAISIATESTTTGDVIFVGGSTFIVADLLPALEKLAEK